MNLTKLFNFKYLRENLKKSKGAVALLILILPIFTLLVTVLLNNNYNVNINSKEEFSILNFIGMYIIPVLISFVLFGYVYKKNSVDFINSQPINRKTIFMTNTLCGIILITLMQVITAIILLICGLVFPSIVIFPKMILDIFIMMWIGYVFVFLASNLAMTVSGTFCTQIVVTLLILFLVPFCYDGFRGFNFSTNYEINNGADSFNGYMHIYDYYTFPYQLIHSLLTYPTDEYDIFSVQSLSKTAIFGIIYYFIGLYLFKNRKMENNEESFANEKIHIFVKALTIIPMMIILNMIKDEKELIIFGLAIIVTYYFVYDFIVKRKVKLKNSLIYLFVTLAILQGTCSIYELIDQNISLPKIKTENIAEVKIERLYYNNKVEYYNVDCVKFGGYIENKDVINLLFDSAYRYNTENYIRETSETIDDDIKVSNEYASCDITFKMKNGKLYNTTFSICGEDFEKIKNILGNDEKFVSNIKNAFIKDGVLTLTNYMLINGDEKDTIVKEIQEKINSMSFEELTKMTHEYEYEKGFIAKYFYENHRLEGTSMHVDMTNEIFKIAQIHMNKAVANAIALNRNYNYTIYTPNENGNLNYSGTYLYNSDEIKNFILSNENEDFDPSKPYYSIVLDGWYRLQFYTNKVDEINRIVANSEEYEDSLIENDYVIYY